jgi:SAM-dependent methyltransferase
LREYFEGVGSLEPRKCYPATHLAFVHRYLAKNIAKDLDLLTHLHALGLLERCHRVVDVGSGPGTFALALLLWLHLSGQQSATTPPVEIVMVDAVREFLDVAQAIWNGLGASATAPVRVKFVRQFVSDDIEPLDERADLVVFSNSLTEILRHPEADEQRLLRRLRASDCAVAVLDHEYDRLRGVCATFRDAMGEGHVEFNAGSRRHRISELSAGFCNHRRAWDRQCCDRSSAHARPERRSVTSAWVPTRSDRWQDVVVSNQVVTNYRVAWETHDLELLERLFTDDAVYVEKASDKPLEGLRRIAEYWLSEAKRQQSVRFTPLQLAPRLGGLTATWECTLFRQDISKWLSLTGHLAARLRGHRICWFGEAFQKRVADRPVWMARWQDVRADPSVGVGLATPPQGSRTDEWVISRLAEALGQQL